VRIGFLVPSSGFVGGIERHAHDLALGLARRGHRLTLLYGPIEGHEAERFAAPFDSALPVDRLREVVSDLDVVYAHRATDPRALEAFAELPLAIAVHDHDHTCIRSHRYLPLTRKPCHRPPGVGCILRGCFVVRRHEPHRGLPIGVASPFRLADRLLRLARRARLIGNSHYIAQRLIDAGVDPGRIDVIHPVPPETLTPVVPAPPDRRLVVAGQLIRGKGVDLAVDALRWLPGEVTLSIAGAGPMRTGLEHLAARVAPGRVDFHGWLPPERLDAVYDQAAIVLVPSRWPEPFGMVGIEGLRRGRPVVGAGHGGIPEWLTPGEGGELFEPGSARALARAVERVLADPGAGQRALRASRRFPFDAMVDSIERRLQQIVEERPGPPSPAT
jgi:glycosyltransferase involved in cell wall biosynthesis